MDAEAVSAALLRDGGHGHGARQQHLGLRDLALVAAAITLAADGLAVHGAHALEHHRMTKLVGAHEPRRPKVTCRDSQEEKGEKKEGEAGQPADRPAEAKGSTHNGGRGSIR